MDLEKLRKQLEIDEGVKYEIYLDHLGYPTFGIGHLVIPSDIEYGESVGTRVSEERVRECFDKDVESVLRDCKLLMPYISYKNSPECNSGGIEQALSNLYYKHGYISATTLKEEGYVKHIGWNNSTQYAHNLKKLTT